MNKQSILIFKLPELFKILNEIKEQLDFDIYNFSKKEEIVNFNKKKFIGYLVLTNSENEIKDEKCQLIINKLPDTIYSIIEKINVSLLKQKYSKQSDILIGKYSIDLNSRSIKNDINENLQLLKEKFKLYFF